MKRCIATWAAWSVLGLSVGAAIADDEPICREPRFAVDPDKPPAEWVLREAAVKTPAESIATFDLPPGFRAEVVASEPIVDDPIAMEFGPDGRLWVVEYPGYNWQYRPKIDLPEEPKPAGRIVVIEDTTGDGVMDRRTVFLDDVPNARAVLLVADGVLVGRPPELWFYRDMTGDGKADKKEKLYDDYGPVSTVHAQPSGLLRAMDNWIYSTHFGARLRRRDGQFERDEPIVTRGQWGMTQDDYGRLVYNTQADPLRGDLVRPAYWRRNPNLQNSAGLNVRLAHDLRGVQAHDATPGVNQRWDGFLDPRGKLVHFTSAAAPSIYRGEQWPEDFRGDALVCVPAGNLIRRYRLTELPDGTMEAKNAYEDHEFLFAHDERVRPVQTLTGPDGALYVVDMYRGIIEGYPWITDETRDYILARRLHEPFHGLGRIYRIVHEDQPLGEWPNLAEQKPERWVEQLSHANGWRRDTAQRLLVEHDGDKQVTRLLRELAVDHQSPAHARLHALWTLEGRGDLDAGTVLAALADPSLRVREAALRLAEPWLDDDDAVLAEVLALAEDEHAVVRRQLLFTLGETTDERAEATMRQVLQADADVAWMVEAAVSGLGGRELAFLESIVSDTDWEEAPGGKDRLVRMLAHAVTNAGDAANLERLANLADGDAPWWWWREAIVAGINDGHTHHLARSPDAVRRLLELRDESLRKQATAMIAAIESEAERGALEVDVDALDESVRELYERGRFGSLVCSACHQSDWQGAEGVAPALIGSDWLQRDPAGMIHIALHGYRDREDFPPMAPLVGLEDEQIAAMLTYLRLTLAESGTAVEPEQVKAIREAPREASEPWTREALEALD